MNFEALLNDICLAIPKCGCNHKVIPKCWSNHNAAPKCASNNNTVREGGSNHKMVPFMYVNFATMPYPNVGLITAQYPIVCLISKPYSKVGLTAGVRFHIITIIYSRSTNTYPKKIRPVLKQIPSDFNGSPVNVQFEARLNDCEKNIV